jgi:hypothetical protein
VSDLIRAVEEGSLVLKPAFQRRLVWTNVVKEYFLDTVTKGLPFPEIFLATGEIDTRSMKRKNWLVDGQQRISTLREYVQGSTDLVLAKVKPYQELTEAEKTRFLDYPVAVRDLGTVTVEEIKEIFARINSTDYALKAMERLNAQFSGEYKNFCDDLSKDAFFSRHRVFSLPDLRRMRDLDFCVILTTTLLSNYYHRDDHNRQYLERYNDGFPDKVKLAGQIRATLEFVESCGFEKKCRVWKKTDLFTLIVEVHSLILRKSPLDPQKVGPRLTEFYAQVDELYKIPPSTDEDEGIEKGPDRDARRYLKAATKATNDKYARVVRAEVIASILQSTLVAKPAGTAPKKAKK